MQVLHVCSEMFPLLKTGGLADVIGALPAAQIADGVDARVLLPAFPDIRRGVTDAQVVSVVIPSPDISRCCSVITTGLAYT
ncbi:glycogen synthase [Escherichia coli]|nr:glycogen synthase [Escherichia coli]